MHQLCYSSEKKISAKSSEPNSMTLCATKKNLDLYIHWASGKVTKIISRDTSCPICSVEITKDLYVITTALIKTNDFKLPYINIPVGTINELQQ